MRATRTLPTGYVRAGDVSLTRNPRLIVWINLLGLLLMILSCAGLAGLTTAIRPDLSGYEMRFTSAAGALGFVGVLFAGAVLTPVLVVVVHEAVHGIAFWYYTRARPDFGYKVWYAYTTAPGWFIPRRQMLVVVLAPLVVVSVACLGTALVAAPPLAGLLLYGAALNIGGAVGDLYLCRRLLGSRPRHWSKTGTTARSGTYRRDGEACPTSAPRPSSSSDPSRCP